MAANRPLKTVGDQASVDSFYSAAGRIITGVIIASGDYHATAPAPAEFTPPEDATAFTATIVTTAANTVSVVFNLEGWDPASGTWVLLLASAAVSTNTTTELYISAYATASANVAAQKQLRQVMRIRAVGTGTAIVYGVSGSFSC